MSQRTSRSSSMKPEPLVEQIKFALRKKLVYTNILETGPRRLEEYARNIEELQAKRSFFAQSMEEAPAQLRRAETELTRLSSLESAKAIGGGGGRQPSAKALKRKVERLEKLRNQLTKLEEEIGEEHLAKLELELGRDAQ